jgi:plasmid stabilization system protein ParE
MAHKLIYRPRAEEDLEAIYLFIAQDSPARAFDFIERAQSAAICFAICRSKAGNALT